MLPNSRQRLKHGLHVRKRIAIAFRIACNLHTLGQCVKCEKLKRKNQQHADNSLDDYFMRKNQLHPSQWTIRACGPFRTVKIHEYSFFLLCVCFRFCRFIMCNYGEICIQCVLFGAIKFM